MAWPSMTDYQEAIQNPGFCFSDPELRRGTPALDVLGLPKPITGGFASVYQMKCGSRQYAVRCFLRYHPDQEARYAAISRYLQKVRLPYTVNFNLLKEGIKVRGQWYPILKMEWLNGQTLSTYIDQNLKNPPVMAHLAQRFYKMMSDLERANIAHGDLQHGNILIVNNDLRLIDYDGMYVPGLEGMQSHEVGHRNYQHPRRTEKDFGPYIDHFSAWIIYLSLLALSVQPGLWRRLEGGDECLLFRRNDFENPGTSTALYVFDLLRNDQIQPLVSKLQSFLKMDLSAVPALDGSIPAPMTLPEAKIWLDSLVQPLPEPLDVPAPPPIAAGASGLDWLSDYLPHATTRHPQTSQPVQPSALTPPEPWSFEQYLLIAYGLVVVPLLALAGIIGWIGAVLMLSLIAGGAGLVLAALFVRFSFYPEVREKRDLLIQAWRLKSTIRAAEEQIQKLKVERKALDQSEQDELAALNMTLADYIQQELYSYPLDRREIKGIGAALEQRLKDEGILTAADINYHRVEQISGIGPDRAQHLVLWRRQIEDRLKVRYGRQFPLWQVSQKNDIIKKYAQLRQQISNQETAAKSKLAQHKGDRAAAQQKLTGFTDVTFATYLKDLF